MGLIKERKLLCFWWMALAAVCAASLIPHGSLPEGRISAGIPARVVVFFLLAFIPLYDFTKLRNGIYAALSMAILGIVLKFVQLSIPGRHYSTSDMLANNIGVLLGFAVGFVVRLRREPKRTQQGDRKTETP